MLSIIYLLVGLLILVGSGIKFYKIMQSDTDSYNIVFINKAFVTALTFTLFLFFFILCLILDLFPKNLQCFLHDKYLLVSVLGLLTSALLASIGVLKSITTTRLLDQEKIKKEQERKRLYTLHAMNTIASIVDAFIEKSMQNKNNFNIDTAESTLQESLKESSEMVKKLLDSLFSDSILPYLTINQQDKISGFYMMFSHFYFHYIISSSSNRLAGEWNILALDRYTHFKIFADEYIRLFDKV